MQHDESSRHPDPQRPGSGVREPDEVLGPEEGRHDRAAFLHARLERWWRELWLRLVLTLGVLTLASAGIGSALARVIAGGDPGSILLALCLIPAAILAAWTVRLAIMRDLPERLRRAHADPDEEGLVMEVFSDHFGERVTLLHSYRGMRRFRSLHTSGLAPLVSPLWLALAAGALIATFGLGVLLMVGGLLRLILG
jgi:hypothetical protein